MQRCIRSGRVPTRRRGSSARTERRPNAPRTARTSRGAALRRPPHTSRPLRSRSPVAHSQYTDYVLYFTFTLYVLVLWEYASVHSTPVALMIDKASGSMESITGQQYSCAKWYGSVEMRWYGRRWDEIRSDQMRAEESTGTEGQTPSQRPEGNTRSIRRECVNGEEFLSQRKWIWMRISMRRCGRDLRRDKMKRSENGDYD